ncbi:MAG: type IX secretion system membrane protein PorP/SprF [Cytophagales bacterium]|nr:type IX secretion system membrane protein PorP/SprF [Cytophagales bacterium]
MTSFFKSGLVRSGLLLSLVCTGAYGQQTTGLPLGALPMQYNSGFAGEAGSPRISTNVGLIAGRGTYGRGYHLSASYDQFIAALRSGIGVSVHQYRTDNAYYATNAYGFSAAIAPKISLGGKWTLSPSLDLSYYGGRSVARDIAGGGNAETERWRSRAGLLFNTSKFYVGYSVAVVDHLSMRFANGVAESGRPYRLTSYLQIGYTFQRSPESNFSFTPQLTLATGTSQYQSFAYNDRIGINYFEAFHLNFRYKQFLWGVNNMGVHVGWQSHRVKVMASNSIGVAGKHIDPGYTGNISLRYLFKD